MARVLFSSGALLRQLTPHIGAALVQLRVARGFCDLWSDEATTGLPCEGNWCGKAGAPLEKLLAALHSIEDQPIVLDLHDWGASRLFACREKPDGIGLEDLIFELCP